MPSSITKAARDALVKAGKPFAAWATEALRDMRDDLPDDRAYDRKNQAVITVADLKAIVAALRAAEGNECWL